MSRVDFMDVSQARDLATFERNLVSMSADLGFPLVGCVLTHMGRSPIDALAVYAVANIPEPYAELSADPDRSIRDPVLTRLREQKFQAVVYDQDFYVQSGAADLWEEQARFGYRCGVAAA